MERIIKDKKSFFQVYLALQLECSSLKIALERNIHLSKAIVVTIWRKSPSGENKSPSGEKKLIIFYSFSK